MIPNFEKYKSVICLDGQLPIEFLKTVSLPILAADGAANTLLKNGVTPTAIIGDLDSVDLRFANESVVVKVHDQDYTDFEKVLSYAEHQKLSPSIITGISGGYLDRIFMNLSIFSQTYSLFYSPDLIAFSKTEDFSLKLQCDTKISLFGAPKCEVTTRGLKWNLNNSELIFGGFSSCSNRTVETHIDFKVLGRIVTFVYLKPMH